MSDEGGTDEFDRMFEMAMQADDDEEETQQAPPKERESTANEHELAHLDPNQSRVEGQYYYRVLYQIVNQYVQHERSQASAQPPSVPFHVDFSTSS